MITEREKALWQILDDIDTASDMFKPPQSAYAIYVDRKCRERHQYLISDGYTLSEPHESKPNQDRPNIFGIISNGGNPKA